MDTFDFGKAGRLIQDYIDNNLKTVIGVEAVKWFQANFEKGGFHDKGIEKWKPLSEKYADRRKSGKILKQSGNLQNSITWQPTSYGVLISTDEPYAEIHNEGGKIVGVYKVNEHWRQLDDKSVKVRSHMRDVSKFPQRQFIGNSHALMQHLEDTIAKDILNLINKADA